MSSYRDLLVWQKAFTLNILVYRLLATFPSAELYGLSSQMKRAVVSILSNIAEGHTRGSTKEYLQFITIAHGSATELETQLLISKQLKFGELQLYGEIFSILTEVLKLLYSFRTSLKKRIAQ